MSDVVFLGDSWLDDEWNGHETFGTLLSKINGWKMMNISKAGGETQDVFKLLKSKHVRATPDTQWIIHLGGNDLLYWVVRNPTKVLYDTWGTSKRFFQQKGEEIAQSIFKVIEYIISTYGAKKIMVSANTACFDVPLCRAFGLIYTPFSGRKHMQGITSVVNLALLRVLQDAERMYADVKFTFYNETLVCADLSWKWDLFHPREESHRALANACYLDLNHSLDHHREYFEKLQHDDVHRFFWTKDV